MPKERVHHGSMYLFNPASGSDRVPQSDLVGTLWTPGMDQPKGSFLREEPSLDIYWNRDDSFVQIAIDAPMDWWSRFWQDRVGDEMITASSVFTGTFTRQEINHTIRTLRRARDAAFGSDE